MAWRETTAAGAVVTVVEVSAEASRDGDVLVVIDLSDSSPVDEGDLSRLRRLLAALPRGWTVALSGLGATSPAVAARGDRVTIGDVVDGAADLAATFLDAKVVGRARRSGSFLEPTLDAFARAAVSATDRALVGIVVTDGRLTDIDPVRLPEGMRLVGIASGAGGHDRQRWREVVGDHEFIGNDGDPVGAVRALAGCAFHGPCTVTIPGGTYRVQAGPDGASGDRPASTERELRWDFSLGRLRLEFNGSDVPAHLDVAGAGRAVARVAVPAVAADPAPRPAAQSAAATVTAAAAVMLAVEEAHEILRRAGELASACAGWFADDGTPTLAAPGSAVATSLLDATGKPAADAFLLIGCVEIDAAEGGAVPFLVVPVHRTAPTCFAAGVIGPESAPLTVRQTWSVHFDNLEARWIVAVERATELQLLPRGSHVVPVEVLDRLGRRCEVFFSGAIRVGR